MTGECWGSYSWTEQIVPKVVSAPEQLSRGFNFEIVDDVNSSINAYACLYLLFLAPSLTFVTVALLMPFEFLLGYADIDYGVS